MTRALIWLAVTTACLAACTFLPICIKNDRLRQKVYWFVLMPVSVVLMVYAYPAGIEVFKNIALHWQ